MIISDVYKGDSNKLLKYAQYDSYGYSVGCIYQAARSALIRAENLLDVSVPIGELAREKHSVKDRRVLRDAHDILAAQYRYRHDDGGQLELFPPMKNVRLRYQLAWNAWLRDECDELATSPEFVKSTLQAVVYVNTPMGYMGEDMLCHYLVCKYCLDAWECGYSQVYKVLEDRYSENKSDTQAGKTLKVERLTR